MLKRVALTWIQMLAIYPEPRSALPHTLKGYTLLELLVVLSLLGMITAITLPNLVSLYNQFSNRLELESIVSDINSIGYRAFQEGRQYWLRNGETIQSNDSEPTVDRYTTTTTDNFPLTLPPGWILSVEQPVHYNFNGACSGGELRLHYLEELLLSETLEPPHCQIHES